MTLCYIDADTWTAGSSVTDFVFCKNEIDNVVCKVERCGYFIYVIKTNKFIGWIWFAFFIEALLAEFLGNFLLVGEDVLKFKGAVLLIVEDYEVVTRVEA